MIRNIASTALNIATCGVYGLVKWAGRRLKDKEGKQTFTGRVMALVLSHAIFSILIGAVSVWGIVKVFGKAILYVCVLILNACGGVGNLPNDEQDEANVYIAKAKDAVGERFDKMKTAMEEQKQKMEAEFARKKKELEERDFMEQIAKKKREAEEEIARGKTSLLEKERELERKASPAAMLYSLFKGDSKDDRIRLDCPSCGKALYYGEEYANHTATCACGVRFAFTGIRHTATGHPTTGQKYWVQCTLCNCKDYIESQGSNLFTCVPCKGKSYILDGTFMRDRSDEAKAGKAR